MSRSTFAPVHKFTGTGSLDTYVFAFKIEELKQLLVIEYDIAGVETQRVRGTDITYLSGVVFDAVDGGGTVTLAANLVLNRTLYLILANDEPTQPNLFKEHFDFTLEKIELALDQVSGATQSLQFYMIRTIKLDENDDETAFNMNMPIDAAGNPDATLAINDAGTGFKFGPTGASIAANTAAAAASAAAAAISETNAGASENAASASETAAGVSENNAATSETNAATSETNAATSETNAGVSENNAATSETNAGASENNAATSAAAALVSENAAAASAAAAALDVTPLTKLTFTHTQFQAAALTKEIVAFALPMLTSLEKLVLVVDTQFVIGGGGTSYKIHVGISGDNKKYVSQFDALQVDGSFEPFTMSEIESLTGAVNVEIQAESDVNLDNSSAGSIDLHHGTILLGS